MKNKTKKMLKLALITVAILPVIHMQVVVSSSVHEHGIRIGKTQSWNPPVGNLNLNAKKLLEVNNVNQAKHDDQPPFLTWIIAEYHEQQLDSPNNQPTTGTAHPVHQLLRRRPICHPIYINIAVNTSVCLNCEKLEISNVWFVLDPISCEVSWTEVEAEETQQLHVFVTLQEDADLDVMWEGDNNEDETKRECSTCTSESSGNEKREDDETAAEGHVVLRLFAPRSKVQQNKNTSGYSEPGFLWSGESTASENESSTFYANLETHRSAADSHEEAIVEGNLCLIPSIELGEIPNLDKNSSVRDETNSGNLTNEQSSREALVARICSTSLIIGLMTSSALLTRNICSFLEYMEDWTGHCVLERYELGCFPRNETMEKQKEVYGPEIPLHLQNQFKNSKVRRSTLTKLVQSNVISPGNFGTKDAKSEQDCGERWKTILQIYRRWVGIKPHKKSKTNVDKLHRNNETLKWMERLLQSIAECTSQAGTFFDKFDSTMFNTSKTDFGGVIRTCICLVLLSRILPLFMPSLQRVRKRKNDFLNKFREAKRRKKLFPKTFMHCPGHNGSVRDAKGDPWQISQGKGWFISRSKSHVQENRNLSSQQRRKKKSGEVSTKGTVVKECRADNSLPVIEAIESKFHLPKSVAKTSPIHDFQSKCNEEFIRLFKHHHIGGCDDELETAGKCYLRRIAELCGEKYNNAECNNTADEIAHALHIINALSLKQFEDLTNKCKLNSQSGRNVVLFCCALLANQNVCISLALKHNTESWYNTKLQILADFLRDEIKCITNCDDSSEITKFFIECAKELQEPQLKQLVEQTTTIKFTNKLQPKCGEKDFANTSFAEMNEADGNIYDRARDPPGQRSVYIPPGDSMKESYRLSTFIKYPQEVPVNPRYLASAGFYYTGYKDRVKCFSCGLCVENWVFGDDVKAHKWHRIDCLFIKGGDSGNEAIGGGFARFMSNNSQPSTPSRQPQSAAGSDSRGNNVQPALQESAGSLLLKHAPSSNSYSPMQTARPVAANSQHQVVEFATITSAYHENFLRNLDLRKESERIRTYEHWPSEAPTVSPKDLAKSGFFYLGNLDRVQCFSCGGVLRNWNYGDHVQSEHRRHFSHCKMVQGAEPRNVRMSNEERATVPSSQHIFHEPPDPTPEQARDLRNMFPCNYAVNPHMRNVESRHATFDTRWPSANINATPRQIANAGFFYLGERDRVKCWYCNGGLQNWDKEDEPWTEHAKWFPTCEFLLQRKGPDFVHRMVSMFPNLNRPILRGPHDVAPSQQHRQIGFSSGRSPSPPPQIIDPQVEMQRQQEELRKAMDSVIVKSALDMGFQEKTLKRLIKNRLQNNNEVHSSVEELIDDVTNNMGNESESDEEEENNQIRQNQSIVRQAMPAAASNFASMETEGESASMQDRIRELQEERNCKICLDQPADVVFVPCGHLCSCKNCAQALRKCPICRKKIEKAIRTYLS